MERDLDVSVLVGTLVHFSKPLERISEGGAGNQDTHTAEGGKGRYAQKASAGLDVHVNRIWRLVWFRRGSKAGEKTDLLERRASISWQITCFLIYRCVFKNQYTELAHLSSTIRFTGLTRLLQRGATANKCITGYGGSPHANKPRSWNAKLRRACAVDSSLCLQISPICRAYKGVGSSPARCESDAVVWRISQIVSTAANWHAVFSCPEMGATFDLFCPEQGDSCSSGNQPTRVWLPASGASHDDGCPEEMTLNPQNPQTPSSSSRFLLDIQQAMQELHQSRTHLFQLLASGELKSIKVGRRRLIPVSAIEQFIARRLREAQEGGDVA